jgi:microsomal dipeptidase-like Zn-dependent dipeptidase
MEYFLERGAEHSLCFGCDMDGADLPREFSSLSDLPALADYLLGYYSEQTVRSVFFENAYHFVRKYFSHKNP